VVGRVAVVKETTRMAPSNSTSSDPAANPASGQPVDQQELREGIRRTRAELGDTVEALARKVDVKARARGSTAAARQRAKRKAVAVAQAVTGKGAQPKEQLAGATAQAASGDGGTPDQAPPDRRSGLLARAEQAARRGGLPLLGVAVLVLVGWLVWRWRRS
jgi:Protein of unknown function (DUF3618)